MDATHRKQAIGRALAVVLVTNVAIAAAKLVLGSLARSVSLHADGVHTLIDGSSNLIALVSLHYASAPADVGHPYGHRKIETIAALGIGVLVAIGGLEIGSSVLAALARREQSPHPDALTTAGVVTAALVGLAVSRYEARRGRLLGSELLAADAGHTLSDVAGALIVLAALGLVRLGVRFADVAGGVAVLVLIGRVAYRIFRDNLGVIADEARLDPQRVREAALSVAGVAGAHKIRSRGTLDEIRVDLHIHVSPAISITEAHRLSHAVKGTIMGVFPGVVDVMVHAEPADGREKQDPAAAALPPA